MKLGNNDISSFKLGSNDVNKIYLGTNELNLGSSLPLNDLTGSTAGFSLRKLNSSYNGSAIQVRRDSDNTTLDIGFVNDELDTSSLNTFSSGTDSFITIWYNQSDTNNNAIQSASSSQPKIYDSSTGVQLENGKPAIKFTKINNSLGDWLEVTDNTFGHIQDAISNFSVWKVNTGTTFYPGIFDKSYSADGSINISMTNTTGKLQYWVDGESFDSSGFGTDIRGNQVLISNINLSGSNGCKIYTNSSLTTEQTSSRDLTGSNTVKFSIGRDNQANKYYTDGTIQEILLFSSNQTANKTTVEDNINAYYSIY